MQNPSLTFADTVAHLCAAIRKLAAGATPEELATPLFRGVRGELPRTFWVPDEQGLVVATDPGFMSTSVHEATPVSYMSAFGQNVLWQLQPQAQSAMGFHRGAPISILSQFSGEAEVLFPPFTMMIAQQLPAADGAAPPLLGSSSSREAIEEVELLPLLDADSSDDETAGEDVDDGVTQGGGGHDASSAGMSLTGGREKAATDTCGAQRTGVVASRPPPLALQHSLTELQARFGIEQEAGGRSYVRIQVMPCFV